MARILPLAWLITFVAVAFGWRSWLQQRRFGHSGMLLFRSGRWPQHVRESLLLVLSVLICAQTVAYAFGAEWLTRFLAWTPPSGGSLVALGAVLLATGVALSVLAQLDLGASWRIGIDETARPGLVTTGLYRFSRNPIYVAFFFSLAGLVVLLPTWLNLGVLVAGVAAIHNQVRAEERYLRGAYGDQFIAYARRVGRFVPGLGTLAS